MNAIKNNINKYSDTPTGATVSRALYLRVSSVEEFDGTKALYNLYDNDETINLHKGMSVEVRGLTNAANNGVFRVYQSDPGKVYLVNPSAVTEADPTEAFVFIELVNHGIHVVPLASLTQGGSSGRVVVSDVPSIIPGEPFEGRKSFLVFNNSDNDIDIGWSSDIIFGSHFPLLSKSSLVLSLSSKVSLYGVASDGQTAEICFMEVS